MIEHCMYTAMMHFCVFKLCLISNLIYVFYKKQILEDDNMVE